MASTKYDRVRKAGPPDYYHVSSLTAVPHPTLALPREIVRSEAAHPMDPKQM